MQFLFWLFLKMYVCGLEKSQSVKNEPLNSPVIVRKRHLYLPIEILPWLHIPFLWHALC